MKILIVGSGGREHAIAASVAKSPRADKIYCAPGNAGIAEYAECVNIGAMEFDKLADLGADLLVKTLPSVFDRTAVMEKQPEESPTPYASMITKQMGLMDFRKSAQELERLVRGMNPWPSAYTFLNGKTFKIWEASVVSVLNGDGKPSAAPGTVIAADSDREGIHVVTEVQLEGKKRMDAASFLRGYQVEPGTVLRDHKE